MTGPRSISSDNQLTPYTGYGTAPVKTPLSLREQRILTNETVQKALNPGFSTPSTGKTSTSGTENPRAFTNPSVFGSIGNGAMGATGGMTRSSSNASTPAQGDNKLESPDILNADAWRKAAKVEQPPTGDAEKDVAIQHYADQINNGGNLQEAAAGVSAVAGATTYEEGLKKFESFKPSNDE